MRASRARATWLDALEAGGASAATIRGYARHTEEALRDIALEKEKPLEELELEEITKADLLAALRRYRARPDRRGGKQTTRASSSVERRLAAVRSMLAWHVAEENLMRNPASGVKVPVEAKRREALSAESYHKLLRAAGQSRTKERDTLLVLLAGVLGMRLSEIAALQHGDVELEAGTLKIRGKKERTLPLPEAVKEAVCRYLPVRTEVLTETGERPWLLLTPHSSQGGYTPEALNVHLTRLLHAAELKGPGITAQSLREGFAQEALRERILSPGEAEELLGSRSIPRTPGGRRAGMLEDHPYLRKLTN